MKAGLARPLLLCCATLLAAACTRVVGGTAMPASGGAHASGSAVEVDRILLDQSRMRAITGAGEDLTIIPSMDGKYPVDVDKLAETVPTECRFVFAETATFGPDLEQFHKTTFQDPPKGRLISEGAAAYRDAAAARGALDALASTVGKCAASPEGRALIGDWSTGVDSLHTRPGGCGRDYRTKSVVLLEVTSCGFPESVSDILLTNIAANVPG